MASNPSSACELGLFYFSRFLSSVGDHSWLLLAIRPVHLFAIFVGLSLGNLALRVVRDPLAVLFSVRKVASVVACVRIDIADEPVLLAVAVEHLLDDRAVGLYSANQTAKLFGVLYKLAPVHFFIHHKGLF